MNETLKLIFILQKIEKTEEPVKWLQKEEIRRNPESDTLYKTGIFNKPMLWGGNDMI